MFAKNKLEVLDYANRLFRNFDSTPVVLEARRPEQVSGLSVQVHTQDQLGPQADYILKEAHINGLSGIIVRPWRDPRREPPAI